MPTIEDALRYLGIDYTDAAVTANVKRALAAAVATLHGAVGADVEAYLADDDRVAYLVLAYTDDLYSERGTGAKVSATTRRLTGAMELQLRLELARAKEAAGA